MSGFRRALAWLGVVDEEDDVEEVEEPISGGFDREVQDTERRVRSDQPAGVGARVQVIPGLRDGREEPADRTQPVLRPFTAPQEKPKIHLVMPTKYVDVQEIGDRIKSEQPVIINLEGVDKELRRRIIDFSSGLAYALGGKLKEISSSVFLLSPSRVEVADEEMFRARQRTAQRGADLQHGS